MLGRTAAPERTIPWAGPGVESIVFLSVVVFVVVVSILRVTVSVVGAVGIVSDIGTDEVWVVLMDVNLVVVVATVVPENM